MRSSLWTWSPICTALWRCLLCVTPLLQGWEKTHLHEKEHYCTTGINVISLSALCWCKWSRRSRMLMPVLVSCYQVHNHLPINPSLVHLNLKSSITGWSFNLLPREHLPSGFGMWRLNKALQFFHSTILLSWKNNDSAFLKEQHLKILGDHHKWEASEGSRSRTGFPNISDL